MAVCVSETTPVLSPDGMFYWDGQAWRPAVSPDGLWRFDGQRWLPTGYIPPHASRPVREPTRWTRPLQAAVIGWQVLGFVIGLVLFAFVMPGLFQQAVAQSSAAPDQQSQQQLAQIMSGMVTVAVVIGLVVGGAIAVLVIVGAMKRWTWLYWTLAVLYLFGALGVINNVVSLFNPSPAGFTVPAWFYAYGIASGLIQTALAAVMIVAGAKIGPWACRRVA